MPNKSKPHQVEHFAIKILAGLDERGWTQADLARSVGIEPNAWKQYMGDRKSLPHVSYLIRIADKFGWDSEYLVDDSRPVGDVRANYRIIDVDLMSDLAEALGETYDQFNDPIGRRDFQAKLAHEYGNITATAPSPAAHRNMVALCVQQLRNELSEALLRTPRRQRGAP